MHEPGVVILTLVAGGVLLAVAERCVPTRASVWWAVAATILLGAGGLSLASITSPFQTLRGSGARAATALVWTTGLLLCLLSAPRRGGRSEVEGSAGRAGLLLLTVAGALTTICGITPRDLWLGLELIGLSGLATRRLEPADDDARSDHDSFPRDAAAGVMATLLFVAGISMSEGLLDANLRVARPVVQTTSDGTEIVSPPIDAPSGSRRDAMAVAFLIASLGVRLMAAPFHMPLWQLRPLRSYVDQTVWLVLGRGAVLVVWARLVILPSNAQGAGIVLTGVTAAVTLAVGSLLLVREVTLRSSLNVIAMIQSGMVLAGLAATGWIAMQPDLPPPGGLTELASRAWVVALIAESTVLLGLGAVLSSLRAPDRELETLEDLRGLCCNAPWACALLGLFVAGIAGIPLTPTLWGRLLVLGAAWSTRRDLPAAISATLHPGAVVLALLVILGWLALVGHALRIVSVTCWRRPVCRHTLTSRWPLLLAAIVGFALVMAGIWPNLLLRD
jgi:NADH:ubiquinone oxidoreductase subunit 2 (subunit N)